MRHTLTPAQDGFTIIELLIATSVFTLVLILLTTGTLAVTRLYYKGLISAQTQTATRNVLNTVTQALQFSGASYAQSTSGGGSGFCIGSSQFSYALNQTVNDTLPPNAGNALLERNVGNATSCAQYPLDSMSDPASTSPTGTELLSDNMSLNNFDVKSEGNNLFCVSIRVIYGDSSLLTPATANPIPDSCGTTYQPLECSGTYSDYLSGQFCAVSGLDTYVQERSTPGS
jgi:prepilin-type N-terminal cleavage/methylation domain-containing protein